MPSIRGTFVENIVGCFFAGFFYTLIEKKFPFNMEIKILLLTGFCGSFTTFSSIIVEVSQMLKQNEITKALSYLSLSFLVGLLLFRMGTNLGKYI